MLDSPAMVTVRQSVFLHKALLYLKDSQGKYCLNLIYFGVDFEGTHTWENVHALEVNTVAKSIFSKLSYRLEKSHIKFPATARVYAT
jgi:hypothetical protein